MNYYHIKDTKKIFLFQVRKKISSNPVRSLVCVRPSDAKKKIRKEIVCVNERVRRHPLLRGF